MAVEDEKRQPRYSVASVSPLSYPSSAVNDALTALRLAARQAA